MNKLQILGTIALYSMITCGLFAQPQMTAEKARDLRLAESKARQEKIMDELLSKSTNDLSLVMSSYYTDFQKGLEYHINGDHLNARVYYEKCLLANPSYTDALYNLADIHSVNGDTPRALALIKKAIENGFSDILGLYADEEMTNLVATSEFKEYVNGVWPPSHKRTEESASIALSFYQNGDYQSAIDKWLEAILAEKSGAKIRASVIATINDNIGNAYLNLGYNQKGLDYLLLAHSEFIAQKREIPLATNATYIGFAYFGMAKTSKAVPYLEEAMAIHQKLGMTNEFAGDIINIAATYYQLKNYEKAFIYANKALDYAEQSGDEGLIQSIKANRASAMIEIGLFEEALPILEKSIVYFEQKSQYLDAAIFKGNLAIAYKDRGDFAKAKSYFQQAINFHKKENNIQESAKLLAYLSDVYIVKGDYKLALQYAKESYDLYNKLDDYLNQAFSVMSIGQVQSDMGLYAAALLSYQKSLKIVETNGLEETKILCHLGMGYVYILMENLQGALAQAALAEQTAIESMNQSDLQSTYSLYGSVYSDLGDKTNALNYYKKALSLAQELNDDFSIMMAKTNINSLQIDTKDVKGIIDNYQSSLSFFEQRGDLRNQLTLLANIGSQYYNSGDAAKAVDYFKKAITIGERLRLEAEGNARRDYLATVIDNYRWLMYCYARQNNKEKVFEVSETIHGRVLGERLGVKASATSSSLAEAQNILNTDQVMLVFTDPTRDMLRITITNDQVNIREEKSEPFENALSAIIKKVNSTELIQKRGFKIAKKVNQPATNQVVNINSNFHEDFEKIVMYYRTLLKSPIQNSDREYIAQKLYTYLFTGLDYSTSDKKELIIIPDGILAYLPFETLITPDGKYLAEKFDIRYIPSFSIYQSLLNRNYSSDRKELLAFGGGLYESDTDDETIISSSAELQQMTLELLDDSRGFKNNTMIKAAYPKLGIGSWADLPGTLLEVENIKRIYLEADIKIRNDVSEAAIKEMTLADYKMIHFATHGIVVPEIPQLSALVLNQQGNNMEDGYLTMVEIENLKLQADFVNLSACETGLGRIYEGEGVVGLTSAFLMAGANAVSASLWQVADESTMEFMTGVYESIKNGNSPLSASAEMKRKFISGQIKSEYAHPFYWAPFVYYGQ